MMKKEKELADRLVEKSVEAFIMGLEIYNKPTIKYRIEGFSFFICNAWELMLKAKLLNDGVSIYYKNKPNRTISLSDTVSQIYSDVNTRIRLNLEKIIDLRNISTHYITEDYEVKYAPLFQACVLNYTKELLRFHAVDITEKIPQNFLTVTTHYEPLSNEQIRLKYPAEIAERFIQQANEIDVLSKEYDSDRFSIRIRQNLYITKKKDEADFSVKIEKDSVNAVNVIKELKDPADTHKYSFNNVVTAVQERLKKNHIVLSNGDRFTPWTLSLFISFYDIKQDERYSYKHKIGNSENYTYSQDLIEFIIDEIKKDPKNFVNSLKMYKKKITPGT